MLGLGEDDPPESTWLHMTSKDFKTDERIPMGKLCISVQVSSISSISDGSSSFVLIFRTSTI